MATAITLISPSMTFASQARAADQPSANCLMPWVCNAGLGLALWLPAGWSVAPPGPFAPNTFDLLKGPAGRGTLSLSIAIIGITGMTTDAAATRISADAATDNLVLPITRRPYKVGRLTGTLLEGMPGQQPTVQIVLAHGGFIYYIVAFGAASLQADQREALATLRVTTPTTAIASLPGSSLGAIDVNPCAANAATSAKKGHATQSAGQLTMTMTGGLSDGFMRVHLRGHGFHAGILVMARLCWSDLPLYTAYQDLAPMTVGPDGNVAIDQAIPLSTYPGNVYTVAARLSLGGPGLGNSSTIVTSPIRFWPAGTGVAVRASMRVQPNHVKPGQIVTITLSGARPGELLDFVEQPDFATGGFGGGIMGQHRASKAGVIRFTYPAPSGNLSIGSWILTAQRKEPQATNVAAFTELTVR